MDRDRAARTYLARAWHEVEADAASYVAAAEGEVGDDLVKRLTATIPRPVLRRLEARA